MLSRKQFVWASLVLLMWGARQLNADMAPEYRPRGQAALSVALIAAASEGDVEGARKLLKRGANPTWAMPARYQVDAFSLENGPALISAIRAKYVEVLRMFLDERPQLIQTQGAAMLSEILAGPHWLHSSTVDLEFLKLLIERKVEINSRGTTPLMLAAARGHVDAVRTLLAAGADASHKGPDGKTALARAREAKPPKPEHAEIIKLLDPVTK